MRVARPFILALAFVLAAAGAASAAPALNRVWSWNVTATTGGLSMELRPLDAQTSVYFLLAKDAALGGATRVGESSLPRVTTGIQSHATLTKLTPGTHYYYKAVAVNASGTSEMRGEFTTEPAVPPTAAISGISNVTYNGALVSFRGGSTTSGTTYVAYSTDPAMAGGGQTSGYPISVTGASYSSNTDLTPGLKAGTKYYVRAHVSNAFGSADSAVMSFTTAQGAARAPSFSRTWSWNIEKTTAGLSMELTNYGQRAHVSFAYGTDPALGGAKTVGVSDLDPYATGVQSHATLAGLAPGTTYYYQASVSTSAGAAKSAIQSFKTKA